MWQRRERVEKERKVMLYYLYLLSKGEAIVPGGGGSTESDWERGRESSGNACRFKPEGRRKYGKVSKRWGGKNRKNRQSWIIRQSLKAQHSMRAYRFRWTRGRWRKRERALKLGCFDLQEKTQGRTLQNQDSNEKCSKLQMYHVIFFVMIWRGILISLTHVHTHAHTRMHKHTLTDKHTHSHLHIHTHTTNSDSHSLT